jgi:outer membrane immunogenic protein
MKKLTTSVAALVLTAGSAFAADLPSRKEPVLPPPPIWSGFYVGLNAGATWGNSTTAQWAMYPAYLNPNATPGAAQNAQVSTIVGSPQLSLGSQLGFLGGGQVGYNYQFNKTFVFGVEADIQGAAGATGRGSGVQAVNYTFNSSATGLPISSTLFSSNSVSKTLNYLGTVRGKIGYLITPTLQVYGTGGLAYGGVTLNSFAWQDNGSNLANEVGPGGSAISGTSVGWTAGGGIEWMLAPAWSVKAEYLYYDLGTKRQFAGALPRVWSGVAGAPGLAAGDFTSVMSTNISTRLNGNVARVGVNYHFNFGDAAPIIAKF